jgi:L-lactate dehydrogenase complex protein LldG
VSARDEVLARIRAALRDAPAPPPVRRDYRTAAGAPALDVPARLALLADRLLDYHTLVRRCGPEEIAETVAAALTGRGVRRLVVPAGLSPAWLERLPPGVEAVGDRQPSAASPGRPAPLSPADLDALDGVITGCALAIAETGTIVLDAGPGQGRRALTLVPDYHLVVIRPDQVVVTVPEGVARLDPTRLLTWISGPSATSDIELDRVEGVHGPRTLEVVLAG